jgi:hypothetical protein
MDKQLQQGHYTSNIWVLSYRRMNINDKQLQQQRCHNLKGSLLSRHTNENQGQATSALSRDASKGKDASSSMNIGTDTF